MSWDTFAFRTLEVPEAARCSTFDRMTQLAPSWWRHEALSGGNHLGYGKRCREVWSTLRRPNGEKACFLGLRLHQPLVSQQPLIICVVKGLQETSVMMASPCRTGSASLLTRSDGVRLQPHLDRLRMSSHGSALTHEKASRELSDVYS